MFQKYKEIIFGIAFGVAAMIIDTGMDAKVEGNTFTGELAAHPAMMLYRLGFVVLGLLLGWLLWRNRKREREVRLLTETLHIFQQQCGTQAVLLRSALQILLTRDDLHLSDEAQRLVHDAYQKSQEFQRIADVKLPTHVLLPLESSSPQCWRTRFPNRRAS